MQSTSIRIMNYSVMCTSGKGLKTTPLVWLVDLHMMHRTPLPFVQHIRSQPTLQVKSLGLDVIKFENRNFSKSMKGVEDEHGKSMLLRGTNYSLIIIYEFCKQIGTYHIFLLLSRLLPRDNPYQSKTISSSSPLIPGQEFPAIGKKSQCAKLYN